MTKETTIATDSKKESLKDAVMKRFSNAPWAKKRRVTVGGAGGIGSNLIYNLVKIGYDIILFEMDIVEAHNVGGQMYFLQDIGKSKASAMVTMAGNVNKDVRIICQGELKETSSMGAVFPITFSCFDSIAARKLLFEKWYDAHKGNPEAIFIDGRLNPSDFEVFAVTPNKADQYRETLFTEEIEALPCNYKATTQTGLMIAGMMVGLMTNFITNLVDKDDVCSIPFRTEFNIPAMYYEVTE